MKYTFLLSALLTLISFPAHALKAPLFAHLDFFSHRALHKKQFVDGLPAEIHDIFINKIKDGKELTTAQALVEGTTLLKSKKYKSWAKQNKEVISSAMDSFYKTHFHTVDNNATPYEQKVTDAIEILYVIQGELDYQPLTRKLKKFLPLEEKLALEQYFLDSVKGLPLEIHTILFRRIKDGRDLTTSEALAEGITLLKSKKYKSWAKQNKEVVSSVMGSFYETHFGYHSDKKFAQEVADAMLSVEEVTKAKAIFSAQKVTDAIAILYVIQDIPQYQSLASKLKTLLNGKEKSAFGKYFLSITLAPNCLELSTFLLSINPLLICAQNEGRKRAYSI